MKQKPHAVSDTSFISIMHDIGYLNSTSEIFGRIYIPENVYKEIKQSGLRTLIVQVENLIKSGFFVVKECSNTAFVNSLRRFLGPGEAEAIALSFELEDVEVIIMDDLKARSTYKSLGATKKLIGTIGVLKHMLRLDIIKEDYDKIVNKLEEAGFRFKKDLFKDCPLSDSMI
ncbi:MAG: hypothetical protein QXU11_12040 [Thermoproteota archaeon]